MRHAQCDQCALIYSCNTVGRSPQRCKDHQRFMNTLGTEALNERKIPEWYSFKNKDCNVEASEEVTRCRDSKDNK